MHCVAGTRIVNAVRTVQPETTSGGAPQAVSRAVQRQTRQWSRRGSSTGAARVTCGDVTVVTRRHPLRRALANHHRHPALLRMAVRLGQDRDPAQRRRSHPGRSGPVPRGARLPGHGVPAARERAARRSRPDLPGRTRAGEDPDDPFTRRAARRVAADRRRVRDQRRPLRAGVPARPLARRRARRADAHLVGAPLHPVRREVGHARHRDRRPHRRGRPDQGGRGSVPVR